MNHAFHNSTKPTADLLALSIVEFVVVCYTVLCCSILLLYFLFSCIFYRFKNRFEEKGVVLLDLFQPIYRFALFFTLSSGLKSFSYFFVLPGWFLLANGKDFFFCIPQAAMEHIFSLLELSNILGLSFLLFLKNNDKIRKTLKKVLGIGKLKREKNKQRLWYKKFGRVLLEFSYQFVSITVVLFMVTLAFVNDQYGETSATLWCWLKSQSAQNIYYYALYFWVVGFVFAFLWGAWLGFYNGESHRVKSVKHVGSVLQESTTTTIHTYNIYRLLIIPIIFAIAFLASLAHRTIDWTIAPSIPQDFQWVHFVFRFLHYVCEIGIGGTTSLVILFLHLKFFFKSKTTSETRKWYDEVHGDNVSAASEREDVSIVPLL